VSELIINAMVAAKKRTNRTRKEHIVPRFLLAQFTDANGRLWVFEKGKPPRQSRPEVECAERDFYEYELDGVHTDNKYEEWLGGIESDAKSVLHLILNSQPLRPSDRVVFASFAASFFVRTRKVRLQL
jgi:hypothetical protein